MSSASDVGSPSPVLSVAPALPGVGNRRRRQEPVTAGIPLPQGFESDPGSLTLRTDAGAVPLQTRVLERWPDNSIRWLLLDFFADWVPGVELTYVLALRSESSNIPAPVHSIAVTEEDTDGVTIATGVAQFHLSTTTFPFARVVVGGDDVIDADRTALSLVDGQDAPCRLVIERLGIEERGPLRGVVLAQGPIVDNRGRSLAQLTARLQFFAGSATVRFAMTLRNQNRAKHLGGHWDLGDAGSVYFRDIAMTIGLRGDDGQAVLRCSPEPGSPLDPCELPLELYQASSGGENWKSLNHLDRHRRVPNRFRGYQLRSGADLRPGLRATPIVSLARGDRRIAVVCGQFWQNFPKAIEASASAITLRLFPRQYGHEHELQGGEQKTHEFFVGFGPDTVTDLPLDWCRAPLVAAADPSWYATAEAVPYLIPAADAPDPALTQLVSSAIEGDDSVERKREAIDEYGWRHFGDLYADHEACFHAGPEQRTSHYNNQYDAVAAFAGQFFRTGDRRWWTLMNELAAHVIDIDIYHTDRDKSAYNDGLFWHTSHYADADTSTHRTYPRAGNASGGPSNEHNYAAGLMLHYFLTGDPSSREAVIGLGRWVVDMDDGRKTVFRWLSSGFTGAASSTAATDYHGPGRGAANSINVLLDAHRLSGDRAYFDKAEQLIRRCIHPADDIEGRDLLDAERRWSYTVFLQTLGRYLDRKAELTELDEMHAYARASLLRYADWMAEHELPYLDRPERLEYPTETWAAQELRKSQVFDFAALHAPEAARPRFVERARFFFDYAVRTLGEMPTRTLTRPMVLVLAYGFMRGSVGRGSIRTGPREAAWSAGFGHPVTFEPQRTIAMRRFLLLASSLATLAIVLGLLFVSS